MAYQPKSHRKFVATSMAAAMVATAAAPAAMAAEQAETSEATITFSDFGENHRAATEVFKLVEEGIIQGFPDGTFRPDTSITRGAAALMLARGLGLVDADGVALEESDAEGFDDVSSADRVYDATRLLKEEDIIGGYADGTFRSDNTITRAEMAIILANAFDLERTSEEFSFTDRGAASQEAVQALYDNGITQGTAQEMIFGSDNEIIRSDFSVQLYRAMGFEEDEAPAALNVQSVVSVNSTTMEVTFEGELTEEDLEDMTFMFDPELEVTNVALKDAEVEAADEHMTTTVVLTTAEQEAGVTYQLTGVNGVALETPVTVEAAPLAVMNVAAVTEAYVTTVTADVTGAEDDAEATVEIFAFGDLDEDPAVTETVDVEDDMVEAEFANLPLGTHIAVVTVGEESDYTEFTVQLEVDEVTSISRTNVDVTFDELPVDFEGVTVEVIDNEGNVREVEEENLVINETEASFEFETALTSDPTGVWTVNGVEFDADEAALLDAINGAGSELAFYNALVDAGIENVNSSNSRAYWTADERSEGFDSLSDVQDFVNEVNNSLTSNEELADQIEALKDAVTSESSVAVLNALSPWERVNADYLNDVEFDTAATVDGYITELTAAAPVETADPISDEFERIQDLIDDVNLDMAKAFVEDAVASADREDYDAAVASLDSVRADDDEDENDTEKADLEEALEELNLIINVLEASTAAQFTNAYNALVSYVDDEDIIGAESYFTSLRTAYMAEVEGTKTISEIRDAIIAVNTEKRAELYNDVANIIDDENEYSTDDVYELLEELAAYVDSDDFDLDTVVNTESRLESYREALAALTTIDDELSDYNNLTDFVNGVETAVGNVQTEINSVNDTAVTGPLDAIAGFDSDAQEAEDLLELLNDSELGLENVVDENADDYFADFDLDADTISNAASIADTDDAIDALEVALKDINLLVEINDATSAQEVHEALIALSNNDVYIDVPSADRLYVAGLLLEDRDDGSYDTVVELREALYDGDSDPDAGVIAIYNEQLSDFNGITSSTNISTVRGYLAAIDSDFADLNTPEQSQIAEDFLLSLEFDSDGNLETSFRTLASVRTQAGL